MDSKKKNNINIFTLYFFVNVNHINYICFYTILGKE